MKLVLETLKEKKFYLLHTFEEDCDRFKDIPEVVERLKQNIKDFEQTIDLIEYFINVKKTN